METHAATDPHAGHGATAHDAHDAHGGIGKYIAVFVALCFLTACSFFTYSQYWPWHDTPQIGWAFMMAVSCTKAMLVIMFFMHLKYEASWKYVLTIPASMMAIFLGLALAPDIGLRFHGFYDVTNQRREFSASQADAEAMARASAAVIERHAAEHGSEGHGSTEASADH